MVDGLVDELRLMVGVLILVGAMPAFSESGPQSPSMIVEQRRPGPDNMLLRNSCGVQGVIARSIGAALARCWPHRVQRQWH